MKIQKTLAVCFIAFLLTSTAGFAETYQSVKITAGKLNVRADMTLDAPILGELDNDSLIETSNLTDGWFEISYSGKLAYISADYTEVVDDFCTGYITGQNVNIRNMPSTQNSLVLSQISNTEVKIHNQNDNWYEITTQDGLEGFVHGDFVSIEAPTNQEVSSPASPSSSAQVTSLIDIAKSKLGCPYVWAGEGPSSFDCSGFIKYTFKEAYGMEMPHSASAISQKGTTISKEDLQHGDLVFFSTNGSGNVNHVGIYIGGSEFIHASSSSTNGHQVHINPLNTGYYNTVYKWAKRMHVE